MSNIKSSEKLIAVNKADKRLAVGTVGIITRHCHLENCLKKMGMAKHDYCGGCLKEEDKEIIHHFFGQCPALQENKIKFREPHVNSLTELTPLEIGRRTSYIKGSKLLVES